MKFNAGAPRPATDDARSARLAAANDLVNRTLAQHGLMPGKTGDGLSGLNAGLPDMTALLGGLSLPGARTPEAPLPDGATFRHQTFTCAEGSRAYRTYVPSTASQGLTGVVVMLHGCTQTPEDFAAGTGMNALAELHRLVVIYPHQARGENAQSCWNWFRRGDQLRDRGEPAILAGISRDVMGVHDLPPSRTFVAGLSAGAAMAIVLGETYPDVFAAVGAHSGLPFGAATDVPSAFAAMAGQGAEPPRPAATAAVPTIVFHGSTDATVHASNGDRIARHVRGAVGQDIVETEDRRTVAGRGVHRTVATTTLGAPVLEHWRIEGLGHAWSGGQPTGSYTDPAGPDASAEMIRFFLETTAGGQ
ncbi:extracellular catalytic domain type 1 short-chain-length polyhydroxyalkanoate depolymerase [Roseivivax sp. CAU 1753]